MNDLRPPGKQPLINIPVSTPVYEKEKVGSQFKRPGMLRRLASGWYPFAQKALEGIGAPAIQSFFTRHDPLIEHRERRNIRREQAGSIRDIRS